jgi:hypothetical protein
MSDRIGRDFRTPEKNRPVSGPAGRIVHREFMV